MNNFVELPVVEPIYSTYHSQIPGTAVIANNPTIRNWYLYRVLNLYCSRKFLSGFPSPELNVVQSFWEDNPHLIQRRFHMKYLKGYVNSVIRELICDGFYVYYNEVDDFYIKGKTLYRKKHIGHDGLICGYNQSDKTYCMYAYDSNWILRKFWTPKKGFNDGRRAMLEKNKYGIICGLKPDQDQVAFKPEAAYDMILKYLDSSLEKYPPDSERGVRGIAVQDYIAFYLGKLIDGSIPYERMDHRIFRLLWEHKKNMQESIACMENALGLESSFSLEYKKIVTTSEILHMMYAKHCLQREDSSLPVMQKKLTSLRHQEEELLTAFTEKIRGAFEGSDESTL